MVGEVDRPTLGEEKRTREREENRGEREKSSGEDYEGERGTGGEENSFWRNNDNGRSFRKRLKERF